MEDNMNNINNEKEYSNRKPAQKKRAESRTGRILLTVIVAFLCLVIGLSAGVAGVGYFLAENDIDIKSIFTGEYVKDGETIQIKEIETIVESEIIKRIEVIDSTTDSPIAAIAEKVIPSIVSVRITFPYTNYFFNMQREGVGEGSGIIISEDGYILTNNHVIEAALKETTIEMYESATIKVYVYDETDKPYEAIVIGRDAITDLALLKIDAEGLVAVDIGDSDAINVGDLAIAIGNPGGMMYMGSVTSGIISGLNREIYDGSGGTVSGESPNLIQTDAAINPGNSGGALVDSQGKLIGINTLKIVSTGYEGLGFAIPVNKAMEIVGELQTQGFVSRGKPNIGISVSTEYTAEAAEAAGTPEGVLITRVSSLSPAEAAGLRVDDIITEINGFRIKNYDELAFEKEKYLPGDEIIITLYRPSTVTGETFGRYFKLPLILGEASY